MKKINLKKLLITDTNVAYMRGELTDEQYKSLTQNNMKKRKQKKNRLSWSDYERVLVVQHQKSFGRAALEVLCSKMTYRTVDSVKCELNRFDDWKRTGIMEFGCNPKHKGGRKGVIATYIRIIKDLGL